MAQLGMVGLGRMGANMARRLMRAEHECVVYDINPDAVKKLASEGAVGADSLQDYGDALPVRRARGEAGQVRSPTEPSAPG